MSAGRAYGGSTPKKVEPLDGIQHQTILPRTSLPTHLCQLHISPMNEPPKEDSPTGLKPLAKMLLVDFELKHINSMIVLRGIAASISAFGLVAV